MHLAANEELRERYKSAGSQLVRLSAENAQLRDQRDAARREACLQKAERMKLLGHSKPVQYLADSEAYQKAWDCFDLGNFHAHNSAMTKSGSYSGKTR